jgi:sec-independent protein translocase protein TatA
MDIGPPELILVLIVVLVLFGGSQLPKLAKNLGKAQREFKSAMDGFKDEANKDDGQKDDEHKDDEPKASAATDVAPAQDEPSTPS